MSVSHECFYMYRNWPLSQIAIPRRITQAVFPSSHSCRSEEVAVSHLRSITPELASSPGLIFGPLSLLDATSSPAPDAAAKLKSFVETEPETIFHLVLEKISAKPTVKLTTIDGGKDFLLERGLIVRKSPQISGLNVISFLVKSFTNSV